MKIYISYFYQIRFMKPYQIPLSTAQWQPKWYGTKPYLDKNGVMNGLCARPFVFPMEQYQKLIDNHTECGKNCGQTIPCNFMRMYREYLDSLNFTEIYDRCDRLAANVRQKLRFEEEPEIILMVHEAKSCKCAERPVLQDWFKANGIELNEWEK